MKIKNPLSYRIFTIVLTTAIAVCIAATLLSYFHADTKYAMMLAFVLFVAMSLAAVGIYAGFRYQVRDMKTSRLNRIGRTGNLVIFLFVLFLMAYAAFTKAP